MITKEELIFLLEMLAFVKYYSISQNATYSDVRRLVRLEEWVKSEVELFL